MKNAGQSAAQGGHQVAFRVAEQELLSPPHEGALAPGQSVVLGAQTTWKSLPFDLPVEARANAAQNVAEQAHHNNARTENLSVAPRVWHHAMSLVDHLGLYDYPAQLLHYPLSFPPSLVREEQLRLQQLGEQKSLPFQLSEVKKRGDFLESAVLSFRADLPRGARRYFSIVASPDAPPRAPDEASVAVRREAETAVLSSDSVSVRVPAGKVTFAGGRTLSQIPAPLLGISRRAGQWIGGGRWTGGNDLRVLEMRGETLENGPLMVRHAVTYVLDKNRQYQIVFQLEDSADFVTIEEKLSGFGTAPPLASWEFSFQKGLEPDGRLAAHTHGYDEKSGPYAKDTREGRLPFALGTYSSGGVAEAALFYRNQPQGNVGQDAILFASHQLEKWKLHRRSVWYSDGNAALLTFHNAQNDKFVRVPMLGTERHWALALMPRADVKITPYNRNPSRGANTTPLSVQPETPIGRRTGFGPDITLQKRLNDFNLNFYKNLIFDFPEDVSKGFEIPGSEYASQRPADFAALNDWMERTFRELAALYWEHGGDLGPNHFGWSLEAWSQLYANNRAAMPIETRNRLRAWLVFMAYLQERDGAIPHQNMTGGQPNFAMFFKQALGILPAVFPQHPHAARWRSEFFAFRDDFLRAYVRAAHPETGASGGRFMENVANYNFASMEALRNASEGVLQYDGSDALNHPLFHDWMRWNLHVLVPFVDGTERVVLPQGAHARREENVRPGRNWQTFYRTAQLLKRSEPELAEQIIWSLTSGGQGRKPALQSGVWTDYGPLLRYDFGGPREAFVHLQQLFGSGYRWNPVSNGTLYYAARGKSWSWNLMEANGDNLNLNRLSVFHVHPTRALGPHPADGVLYDFGGAQFYRALAQGTEAAPYLSRSVLMVRDDFLAVHDDLSDANARGTFRWSNEEEGVVMQRFENADFTRPQKPHLEAKRFPLEHFWPTAEHQKPFSVRWNGAMNLRNDEFEFRFELGPNSSARAWIGDELVADSTWKQPKRVRFEAGRHNFKAEFVHNGGPDARVNLRWWRKTQKPSWDGVWAGLFIQQHPLPSIHQVYGSPGDALHIVSPQKLAVQNRSWGAVIGEQAVLIADQNMSVSETIEQRALSFEGKTAYASAEELCLFEGTKLQYGDFGLKVEGDFGASLQIPASAAAQGRAAKLLSGTLAGRGGGTLRLLLPAQWLQPNLQVRVAGVRVNHRMEGAELLVPISLQQSQSLSSRDERCETER